MAATESDLAAKLLERLLSDQAFRAQFRRDPAGACREAGLDSLAQEMSVGGGKAMMTLDIRESKSSLAGVMMAAAMEGVGIYQFTENILPHLEEIPGQVADVLSRVDMPAIPDFLKKPVSGGGAIATAAEPSGGGDALGGAADAGVPAGGGGAAAAAAAPPVVPEAPADGGAAKEAAAKALEQAGGNKGAAAGADAAADGKGAAAGDKGADAAAGGKDAGADNSAAEDAAKQIAKENSPETAQQAKEDAAANALDEQTTGAPGSSDLPTTDTTLPTDAPPADTTLPTDAPPAGAATPPVDPAASAPPATPAPPETPAPPADPAAEIPSGKPVEADAPVPPPEAGGEVPPPEAAGGDAVVPPPEAGGNGAVAEAAAGKGKAKSGVARLADALTGRRARPAPTAVQPAVAASTGDAASVPKGSSLPVPADTTLPTDAPAAGVAPADTTLPTDAPAAGAAPADTTLPTDAPAPDDTTLPTSAPDLAESVVYSAGKPEALALLKNKNIVLDAAGKKELRASHVDPRVVAVLTKLSADHKITVNRFADGVDISAIDGEPVSPDSPIAREVASELSQLNKDYRPDEIGSPFQIRGHGYFTDAEHQTSIHVGFQDDLPEDWKPPSDVAVKETVAPPEAAPQTPAVAPAPDAAPVAAPPVTPAPVAPTPAPVAEAAAADPPPKRNRESQLFLKAVSATAAAKESSEARKNPSQIFQQVVEAPKPKTPVAVAAAVDPAALAQAVAAPGAYPGDSASQEQVAAWMASEAQRRGLPPELPLMASLVESGMKNLHYGDADSVGFFQMRVGIWDSGPYKGFSDHPELQLKWFLDNAETVKKARIAAGKPIDDPNQFGDWIADVERPAEQYRGRYQLKLSEAQELIKNRPAVAAPAAAPAAVEAAAAVAPAGGGGSSLGAAALQIAHSQKGVREIGGANMGPQVNQYLAAAKVAPGNPWCASFVTWSLEKAGHKMPGQGWAAVQTWVRNAEAGQNNLKIVSPEDARPGDIVAYDWGGQDDFGSDGHIGFLDSTVQGGKFKALEGNNADAVTSTDRQMGSANIKFIRIEGNASPGAAAQVAQPSGNGVAQVADQAPAGGRASAPIDPTQFGAEGGGGQASAEALALLNNKNVVFDSDGIADIKAGRIDPRVVAVLTKLSGEHKITVTCMCSDHDKFTAGGSVSNHHFGRGMDIGAIDGEIVGPGSPLAREVASELSQLNPDYRPNEIGSPFAIAGPGYFTDAAHQNHIHVGFKQEISADWKPPADVASAAPAPVATAAAVQPGTPAPAGAAAAAAAAEPPPKRDKASQLFLKAVTAKAAESDAKERASTPSQLFQKVDAPPKAAAAAAPAPAVDPAAAQQAAPAQPAVGQAAAAADPAAAAAVAAAAPDAYPGDNAPQAEIAAWMAGQAQKRGLPPQLPLMASLVESGMKNLNFGDADSVGFFQMRVGIWNQGAYAGFPDKPELQVKWFLDQAEAVKRQRLVAGKSVSDPNQFGDWIADVERPAAQYRGRYQLKLDEANSLLSQAPSQPAAAPPAASLPVADPAAAAASAAALGDAKLPAEVLAPVEQAIAAGDAPGPKALAAIQEASKYIGTDYKWGGSTPQTGFDCSGLMQWAYAQSGIQIPRVTYTQIAAANGVEIADRAALKPGDLVFFANQGDVHHVGMYLGGDKFLHAPHTGDVVKVSSLDEPYYASQFAGGRRFDQAAGVAAVPASAPAAAPVAAAAAAAPAAPAIDPADVAKAQAAVARDAAEVRRNASQLFQAVKAVEASKEREKKVSMMFLKAIDPSQVKRPAAAAAAAAPPPAAPPVTPPAEPAAASLPVEPTPPAAPVAPTPPSEVAAPAQPDADAATPAGKPAQAGAPVSIDLADTTTDYPGDNAGQAALAKWLGKQAEKAGLPPELPVMASLVESGVRNLNYGDRDSVGFFQMRTQIWNSGAYAGYPQKPELQAKWFIDQALAVKKQAIARGDVNFGKDPNAFGEWIADVERPAEQYRGRYQLRLGEARKLLG
ncbi:NlpC/P60 family protein [Solirubrobacter soli]|uniref:NlpC/P60 family protein n=1 Tax=Solirubrobacter soli TaxID=363832 RepID=UPI0004189B7C|nr:NlpC/P60 family protein [Solirubrobacter soli]